LGRWYEWNDRYSLVATAGNLGDLAVVNAV
jgi:hypothetical protein